jgi:hypothetical protein
MASLAPSLPLAVELDPVLDAAQRAPLVEETEAERALMAEVEGRPMQWIPTDQFMSTLRPGDDPR